MKLERSEGIILRTRILTESSLIVHWLTPDLGRLATVAKGAFRPRSPFRGKLDLFYLAEFSFQRSRRSDLHLLRETVLRQTHPALRRDLARLQQAAYAAALIEQATETETPLPFFYQLLRQLLEYLDSHPPRALVLLSFEVRTLEELGLSPGSAGRDLSSATRPIFEQLFDPDWGQLAALPISSVQLRELSSFLHSFLAQHLERVPRGRQGALTTGKLT